MAAPKLSAAPVFVFAARLRALRAAAGLRQIDLAEKAGINRVQIALIESGAREPRWTMACSLAEALGVSLDEFR